MVNDHVPRAHGGQGHASRARLLSQQDKQGVAFPLPPGGDDCVPQRDSVTNIRMNSQFSDHPFVGPDNPYVLSDGQIVANDTILRMERKRKVF